MMDLLLKGNYEEFFKNTDTSDNSLGKWEKGITGNENILLFLHKN